LKVLGSTSSFILLELSLRFSPYDLQLYTFCWRRNQKVDAIWLTHYSRTHSNVTLNKRVIVRSVKKKLKAESQDLVLREPVLYDLQRLVIQGCT
jgi:hypothetical protein